MDLDETVLDNSGYQADLIRTGRAGTADGFFQWAGDNPGKVGLVPGAREFIRVAQAAGIRVVFISNRPESIEHATRESLANRGIHQPFDLHLRLDSYDKNPRFDRVRDNYYVVSFIGDYHVVSFIGDNHVVSFIGDNLSDFPEGFEVHHGGGALGRREKVTDRATQFGRNWFILPNPSYGDWVKYVEPGPIDHLRDGSE